MFLRCLVLAAIIGYATAGKCRGHRTTESPKCCSVGALTRKPLSINAKLQLKIKRNTTEDSVYTLVADNELCAMKVVANCSTEPYIALKNSHLVFYRDDGGAVFTELYPFPIKYDMGLGHSALELNCFDGKWKVENGKRGEVLDIVNTISCAQNVEYDKPWPGNK